MYQFQALAPELHSCSNIRRVLWCVAQDGAGVWGGYGWLAFDVKKRLPQVLTLIIIFSI